MNKRTKTFLPLVHPIALPTVLNLSKTAATLDEVVASSGAQMDFDNKVGLIEFAEEVQSHFTDSYTSYNYREDIANALERHKSRYWPTLEMPQMPEIWRRWLSDAKDRDWFVGKYRQILSITPNTIKDFRKGNGHVERAIAIHYRLYRSLDDRELSLALELDRAVFGCGAVEKLGVLFVLRPPDIADFDGVNSAPSLAELDGAGWTQMASDSSDFELQAELFCRQASQKLNNTRRLRYGLSEVWLCVKPKDFDVVKQYRGGQHGHPPHLHFHGRNTWKVNASDAPIDNFGMLDGSVLAGPICLGNPRSEESSMLEVEVYIPKTSPKLAILAKDTDDRIEVEDEERRNLVEKMFLIYLHKLHQLEDSELIILSSAQVST